MSLNMGDSQKQKSSFYTKKKKPVGSENENSEKRKV
jgi:hypothetical protein